MLDGKWHTLYFSFGDRTMYIELALALILLLSSSRSYSYHNVMCECEHREGGRYCGCNNLCLVSVAYCQSCI